jgi:hypothetical protein
MKSAALVIFISLSCLAQATKPRTTLIEDLAKPTEWKEIHIKILADDPRPATFTLVTSWIPGDAHKGYIRYRIKGWPSYLSMENKFKNTVPDQGWDEDIFVEKIHRCDYYFVSYDGGGFKLRETQVYFQKGVDSTGKVISMESNDMFQMDLSDYKSFSGNPSGSWDLLWSCPK